MADGFHVFEYQDEDDYESWAAMDPELSGWLQNSHGISVRKSLDFKPHLEWRATCAAPEMAEYVVRYLKKVTGKKSRAFRISKDRLDMLPQEGAPSDF